MADSIFPRRVSVVWHAHDDGYTIRLTDNRKVIARCATRDAGATMHALAIEEVNELLDLISRYEKMTGVDIRSVVELNENTADEDEEAIDPTETWRQRLWR